MTTAVQLGDNQRKAIADALARVLADTYVLKVKAQGYHWNVLGPHFNSLHAMFQAQYEAMEAAIDEVAERIRALGVEAPGSMREFLSLTTLTETSGAPSANDMIGDLLAGHETLAKSAAHAFAVADEAGDDPTGDLMIERRAEHEKFAWMLRSQLDARPSAPFARA